MRVDRSKLNDFIEDITLNLYQLNADNKLEQFLTLHNFQLDTENIEFDKLRAKILIIGDLSIDINVLYRLLADLKIDKDRVEIAGDYYDAVTYPWERLKYNDKYSDVILGPMPHSGEFKGKCDSIISRVKKEDGFPNVIECKAESSELLFKMTKSSLRKALSETKYIKYCI